MALSEVKLRNLKPKDKAYQESDGGGMFVEVLPSGGKVWRLSSPEVAAAKAIIQRIRKGDLKTQFSSRDVWRPNWANLSDRQLVADALVLLADLDWLRSHRQETAGRTATIYEVNPKGLMS